MNSFTRFLLLTIILLSFHASADQPALHLIRADSEETIAQDGHAQNALDGDPTTYWHTQWQTNNPALPHEIIIELIPPTVIQGVTYLPRQDPSDHGHILDYELYVSDRSTNFTQPVSHGTFTPGKDKKLIPLEPMKCRYLKLKALTEINHLPWTSAAEINILPAE